jgi:DegV family protein with EDD domain
MKEKIAILTDSTSSIYTVKNKTDNIFMINSPAYIGEEMFTDFEKNGDAVFYEALAKTTIVPKTSQPSTGETLAMYEYIKSLGYTHIIYLPISQQLSGTYQNGYLAREFVEGIDVRVVDTLTTVSILAGMTVEAGRLAKLNTPVDEIIERVLEIKEKSNFFATVKDITALVKNGRLSNAKGFVANLLNIRPIIHLSKDGKVVGLKNVRTYNNALKAVIDLVAEGLNEKTGVIHLSYTNNEADKDFALELLKERFPNNKIEIYTLPATIVAHTGLNTIAVGYINY